MVKCKKGILMDKIIENVFAGLIANVIFLFLTLTIGYIFYLVFLRRSLYNFWGIRDIRKIRIYTSHLRVVRTRQNCPEECVGGAIGADGLLRSFQGSVVTQLETFTATLIRNLFYASLPGQAVQPVWLKSILLTNADAEVVPSPVQGAPIDPEGTVVTLGSPGYNDVSRYIEDELHSPVRFVDDNQKIQLQGGLQVDNPTQGVIVRIKSSDRFFFYTAGLSEGGTAAAAYYLANSWKKLYKRYKKIDSFFVVVQFHGQDYRMTNVITEGAINQN